MMVQFFPGALDFVGGIVTTPATSAAKRVSRADIVARKFFNLEEVVKGLTGGDEAAPKPASPPEEEEEPVEEEMPVLPIVSTYDLNVLEPMLERIYISRRTETYDRLILRPMLARIEASVNADVVHEQAPDDVAPEVVEAAEPKEEKKPFNPMDASTWGNIFG